MFGFGSKQRTASTVHRASGSPLGRYGRTAGLVALLLAAVFAWDGWSQASTERDRAHITRTRDAVVEAIAQRVTAAQSEMDKAVADPQMGEGLAAGNNRAVTDALRDTFSDAERVDVWPATMQAQYAALPADAGLLAAAEAALSSGSARLRIVQREDGARTVIAAPLHEGNNRYVTVVQRPLSVVTEPLDSARLGNGYLALRQGTYSVAEQGDQALMDQAEGHAQRVGETDMRIAAALPAEAFSLFGLGMWPSFVLAALLGLAALAAWLLPARLAARGTRDQLPDSDDAPTFTEALRAEPLPASETPRPAAKPKPAPVAVDASIFRAYDIRGIMGQTLDRSVAEQIGQAIGSLMHEQGLPDIVVGRDGRLSGPELASGLIAGLRKAGRNVIDIGVGPTPLAYFGSYHLRTGCCVAVTGSHNPPDYNGFKIVVGGETLSGDAITALHRRISEGALHTAEHAGLLTERDIGPDYVNRISGDVMIERPLKVVVDAGNGAAGDLGPQVLEAIGAHVTPLYCEIDGTFPNHHPDPGEPDTLHDLIQMVQRMNADLGIAFDGDGDRLGVVTAEGQVIYPDRLLMLFAEDVLERNPGSMIVYDVKCSGHLQGHILRHGGSPLMWKTGHSLIKAKMRETHAELAGEMSGHFFFAERWYGFDDGIYAAARLLEILAGREQSPTEVLKALPDSVSTPELKVPVADGDPHALVARFRAQASFEEGARRSEIDGVRVDWPDGWGLVRASNTTPVVVMRFDAESEQALARIQQTFRQQLLAVEPGLALPF